MREMIFNHASVGAHDSGIGEASQCLRDVVGGMRQLIECGAVSATLRTARYWTDVWCQQGNYSLGDVLRELQRQHREEYSYFVRLATKSPFLAEIDQGTRDRLALCEERTLSKEEGQPLLLCVLLDGVLIGFPSEVRWNRDHIDVEFIELLPDETFSSNLEKVDQLTRVVHADPICARHRLRVEEDVGNDPSRLWENRQNIFPYLQFGPDVEQNLVGEANHLPVIIKKLKSLNQTGKEWREADGVAPLWKTKVTLESDRVMNSQMLRNQRYFRSRSGSQELFQQHARFGGGGRIHLRLLNETRTIEIGYIGPHLPL